jgi:hypothetical protein
MDVPRFAAGFTDRYPSGGWAESAGAAVTGAYRLLSAAWLATRPTLERMKLGGAARSGDVDSAWCCEPVL